jgi:hypothetical protein
VSYLKKPLDSAALDTLRINLSVRSDKIASDPVCDFCGNHTPVVVYASSRMSTGAIRQCWRWTACGMCEALVDTDKWTAMHRRVTARLRKMLPPHMPKAMIELAVSVTLEDFHKNVVRE